MRNLSRESRNSGTIRWYSTHTLHNNILRLVWGYSWIFVIQLTIVAAVFTIDIHRFLLFVQYNRSNVKCRHQLVHNWTTKYLGLTHKSHRRVVLTTIHVEIQKLLFWDVCMRWVWLMFYNSCVLQTMFTLINNYCIDRLNTRYQSCRR